MKAANTVLATNHVCWQQIMCAAGTDLLPSGLIIFLISLFCLRTDIRNHASTRSSPSNSSLHQRNSHALRVCQPPVLL
jgi:hypothetical protein